MKRIAILLAFIAVLFLFMNCEKQENIQRSETLIFPIAEQFTITAP